MTRLKDIFKWIFLAIKTRFVRNTFRLGWCDMCKKEIWISARAMSIKWEDHERMKGWFIVCPDCLEDSLSISRGKNE